MKSILNIVAMAVLLLVAPTPCFALWDVVVVSKDEAKRLGFQVRSRAAGPNHVNVELEFKTEGNFKEFSPEGKSKDRTYVELWIGQGEKPQVSAALREDRSKAGRVAVSFTVEEGQLNQSNLRVMVPYSDGGLGGIQYRLRIKDFVELKEQR